MLKIGEYTRINGKIGKVKDIVLNSNNYEDSGIYLENEKFVLGKEEIYKLKSSYNIIDLIEEGDYVNGYKVLEIVKGFKVLVDKLELNTSDGNYYLKQFTNNEIKSIVTKEVFKANEYRMETD